MTIREQIDSNLKQRESLLEEYYAIQKKCKHPNTEVVNWGDIRHNNLANVCTECNSFISYVKEVEVISVKTDGNNTFDVEYKTDAKPGEMVRVDLSDYLNESNI